MISNWLSLDKCNEFLYKDEYGNEARCQSYRDRTVISKRLEKGTLFLEKERFFTRSRVLNRDEEADLVPCLERFGFSENEAAEIISTIKTQREKTKKTEASGYGLGLIKWAKKTEGNCNCIEMAVDSLADSTSLHDDLMHLIPAMIFMGKIDEQIVQDLSSAAGQSPHAESGRRVEKEISDLVRWWRKKECNVHCNFFRIKGWCNG